MSKDKLIEMQKRTPGRYGQVVKFQGIPVNEDTGKPLETPADVLDSILGLADNDQEKLWTIFVAGYNDFAFNEVADPLQPYYQDGWTSEQIAQFRQMVNAGVRFSGKSQVEIAEGLLNQMGLQPKAAEPVAAQ